MKNKLILKLRIIMETVASSVLLTASETWQDFCNVNILWSFLTLVVAGASGYFAYVECGSFDLLTLSTNCERYFALSLITTLPFIGSQSNSLRCILRSIFVGS